jgi:hypothetical protein
MSSLTRPARVDGTQARLDSASSMHKMKPRPGREALRMIGHQRIRGSIIFVQTHPSERFRSLTVEYGVSGIRASHFMPLGSC